MLGNWARDPRPSEYDAEIDREIEWIEGVIRSEDASLIREVCGDIRGGLVRLVELRSQGSPAVRPEAVLTGNPAAPVLHEGGLRSRQRDPARLTGRA